MPDVQRLGGIGWLERTNGALTSAERRRLVGPILRGQAQGIAGRLALLTGRRCQASMEVPAPPDSLAPASVVGWMDGSYGVNANSDTPDEAKALVEWMGTQEFGQLFTENIKQLSPLPGTVPEDELLAEFSELFEASPVSYLHLVNFRYEDPNGDVLLRDGITKMWLGEATPEEVAADVQTGLEQWFTPGE